jgi:hypothetical protein
MKIANNVCGKAAERNFKRRLSSMPFKRKL